MPNRKKIEYDKVTFNRAELIDDRFMNLLANRGQDGWELCGIYQHEVLKSKTIVVAFFKREIFPHATTETKDL